ncbi:hypothetical protein F5Y13DRAFT_185345 [Hypoxylon sp. FL1857]|nr:hypothetical protein F5Y13DRAFT_185345 [Hypoxylon sp. FL1857]
MYRTNLVRDQHGVSRATSESRFRWYRWLSERSSSEREIGQPEHPPPPIPATALPESAHEGAERNVGPGSPSSVITVIRVGSGESNSSGSGAPNEPDGVDDPVAMSRPNSPSLDYRPLSWTPISDFESLSVALADAAGPELIPSTSEYTNSEVNSNHGSHITNDNIDRSNNVILTSGAIIHDIDGDAHSRHSSVVEGLAAIANRYAVRTRDDDGIPTSLFRRWSHPPSGTWEHYVSTFGIDGASSPPESSCSVAASNTAVLPDHVQTSHRIEASSNPTASSHSAESSTPAASQASPPVRASVPATETATNASSDVCPTSGVPLPSRTRQSASVTSIDRETSEDGHQMDIGDEENPSSTATGAPEPQHDADPSPPQYSQAPRHSDRPSTRGGRVIGRAISWDTSVRSGRRPELYQRNRWRPRPLIPGSRVPRPSTYVETVGRARQQGQRGRGRQGVGLGISQGGTAGQQAQQQGVDGQTPADEQPQSGTDGQRPAQSQQGDPQAPGDVEQQAPTSTPPTMKERLKDNGVTLFIITLVVIVFTVYGCTTHDWYQHHRDIWVLG